MLDLCLKKSKKNKLITLFFLFYVKIMLENKLKTFNYRMLNVTFIN